MFRDMSQNYPRRWKQSHRNKDEVPFLIHQNPRADVHLQDLPNCRNLEERK